MWAYAKDLHNGDTASLFTQGLLRRTSWQKQDDTVTEKATLLPWGRVVVGLHGGDGTQAIAAMDWGEVEPRANPSAKGSKNIVLHVLA